MKKILFVSILTLSACSSSEKNLEEVSFYTPRASTTINLTGQAFYPDSIAAMKDGTLFVGSMGTGQIDKIEKNSTSPSEFIKADKNNLTALGMLVDEKNEKLWACHWDFKNYGAVHQARLQSFNLKTGALESTHLFPKGSLCNDLTMDGTGNIYVTCSFTSQIYRLAQGEKDVVVWSKNEKFSEGKAEGAWTINGITWDGKNSLYITRTDKDALLRIAINENGSAGDVDNISINENKSNMGYDGIKAINANNLLIAEYATGRVSKVTVDGLKGTKTIIAEKLEWPTNISKIGDTNDIWIAESQINHLLGYDPNPPTTPFTLKQASIEAK